MNNTDLKKKMIVATKWSSITELAAKVVIPLTSMILARILAPEAFGVIATITMIISFADMFADSGFQKYLIQHEFKDNKEKLKYANVAFWTNLTISLLIWVIIIVLNEEIAALLGSPDLGFAIAVACIQLPLTAFSSIQISLYRREFDFKTLFWVRLASVFIPFIVTIPLALIGMNFWSIIVGTIVSNLFNAVLLTIKSKWKPSFFYKFSILKEMLSFSIWSLVESISIWLTIWIDAFIIGLFLNEYYLGLYKTSTTMVNSLLAIITAATTPILFSALSRAQKDEKLFNKTFFKMQRLISIFIFPVSVGVLLFDDLVVSILFGNQWSEASEIVGIWIITSAFMIIFGHYSSEVYRAKGRPKLSFTAQMLHLVVLVPVCLISIDYSFWFFVYARSLIRLEAIIVHLLLLRYILKFPVFKMFSNVFPPMLAATIMGGIGYYLNSILMGVFWDWIIIFLCIIIYFGILLLLPGMKKELLSIMKMLKSKVL